MATGWKMSSEDAPRVIDTRLVVASYTFDEFSQHRSVKYWRYRENVRAELDEKLVWLRTASGTYWREPNDHGDDVPHQLNFVGANDIGIIRSHPVPELACLRSIDDFKRLRIGREDHPVVSKLPSELAGRDVVSYDFKIAHVSVDLNTGAVLAYEMKREGRQRVVTTSFTAQLTAEPIAQFTLDGD